METGREMIDYFMDTNNRLVVNIDETAILLMAKPISQLREMSGQPKKCVYLLLNIDNKVQYVGRTANPKRRITTHVYQRRIDVRFFVLVDCESYMLKFTEYAFIGHYKPPFNVLGHPDKKEYLRAAISKKSTPSHTWLRRNTYKVS